MADEEDETLRSHSFFSGSVRSRVCLESGNRQKKPVLR